MVDKGTIKELLNFHKFMFVANVIKQFNHYFNIVIVNCKIYKIPHDNHSLEMGIDNIIVNNDPHR